MDIEAFIAKWEKSEAAERANKDYFLLDLCEVLGVDKPAVATGDPAKDTYTFERDAVLIHEGQTTSVGKMDLYKQDHLVLEAKQGSKQGSKKLGSAKRGTPGWNLAMHDAYGQAVGYARTLAKPPPFIITTDIGYCFEIYAAFDGTGRYSQFPDVKHHRIYLPDLRRQENLDLLRAIFTDPYLLDPSRQAMKVTREVAGHLAGLAKALEADGHSSERVARFLMRAIFTMFAEDVGLLRKDLFKEALNDHWIPHPRNFKAGIEGLWKAMNEGTSFGFFPKLLQFNGGLFRDAEAIPLSVEQLKLLLEAAECDWSEVEPSIFGTLLERAIDPRERHRLGAHFTPRSYVERLVRPTIEEPLREEWDLVRAEVRSLVEADAISKARKVLLAFQTKLAAVRVLDPACGSGNFLYVTLDLMKRLEAEVLAMLSDVEGGKRSRKAGLAGEREGWAAVTPGQFLGIEVKPWAKEIAELVLWIGYLQWHFRTHGRDEAPAEPVLHDYRNIECRDAVLEWDKVEDVLDGDGNPLTRWDGQTMKASPVTGELVPDETARVPVVRFTNPRSASWPKADFIVGNPPFIGNKRMRGALGDGYVEALRAAHDDVPDSADFVMYWWNQASRLVREKKARRFGLITTNSITQTGARPIVQGALKRGLSIVFAVADHPWVDSTDGAAVRIAMTAGVAGESPGRLLTVVREVPGIDGEVAVECTEKVGRINADLTIGVDVTSAVKLTSNSEVCFQGFILVGKGFCLTPAEATKFNPLPSIVRPWKNGKDLLQKRSGRVVIDFFGLSKDDARKQYPKLYQHVLNTVKPLRDEVARKGHKENWWIWGEARPGLRKATNGLSRMIVTNFAAKHRVFVFEHPNTAIDHNMYVIAVDSAALLGVLSARPHVTWMLAAGSSLEDRPTWVSSTCFDPYPFPEWTSQSSSKVAALAEGLDAHRNQQLALHPDLTLTNIYNVLDKLRSGEPLTEAEKDTNNKGLVSVLLQIHDDLDTAVFDAYGWPAGLTDQEILERLVKLNAKRAAEEESGTIRWIRPTFQKANRKVPAQPALIPESVGPAEPAATGAQPWPKSVPEQIAAARLLLAPGTALSLKAAAKAFVRANKADLSAALDALVALGLAVKFESGGEPCWQVAGRAAA